jgi:hypothetical protein
VFTHPTRLWHYPGTPLSCRLRFGQTAYLTIRNSATTCRWLARHAAGWRIDDQTGNALRISRSGQTRKGGRIS